MDVLVSFDGPAMSQQYFGVQFYLEDLFGHPVDLVTEKALSRNCGLSSRKKPPLPDDRGRPWRFYPDDMISFAEKASPTPAASIRSVSSEAAQIMTPPYGISAHRRGRNPRAGLDSRRPSAATRTEGRWIDMGIRIMSP